MTRCPVLCTMLLSPVLCPRVTTMMPREYSVFSSEQCPRALALMAGLCVACGNNGDANQWLVELVGAVVLSRQRADATRSAQPRRLPAMH